MKFISCMLAICMCFAMAGCGSTSEENIAQTTQKIANSSTETHLPTEETEPTTVPAETTESNEAFNENAGSGDIVFLYAGSLEEYEKHFAENGGYPENFVTYEDLRELGSFESFRCQSYNMHPDVWQKDYTTYGYGLKVDGIDIDFSVLNARRIPEDIKNLEFEDVKDAMVASDLRTNNADVFKKEDIFRGELVCGEYTYQYIEGKLHAIVWIVGETEVTITIPSLSHPWPENDPDTLIGRMLIWDTAEEALGELREKIDGKLKDLKYPD